MSKFVIGAPYDGGSFTQVGPVSAGLPVAHLLDDRVRVATRFTSLSNAAFTYDLGASRPSTLDARLSWLGYMNLTPYRNLIYYPRDISQGSKWTNPGSGVTITRNDPVTYPDMHQDILAAGAGSIEHYIEQNIPAFFSGWSNVIIGNFAHNGGLGANRSAWEQLWCLSCVVACSHAGDGWSRVALVKTDGTVLLGFNVDTSSGASGQDLTFEKVGSLATEARAVRAIPDAVGNINFWRVWVYGTVNDVSLDGVDLRIRHQLLDGSKNTSFVAAGERFFFDGTLLEMNTDTPTDFVDNGSKRGPVVRVQHDSATTDWATSTAVPWVFTHHAVQAALDDPSDQADIHTICVAPDAKIGYRYVRVSIDDPDNADGYIDVGRFVSSACFQPTYNMDFGVQIFPEERVVRRETGSGQQSAISRPNLRVARFTHAGTEDESKRLRALYDRVGTSNPVIFCKDPDSIYAQTETLFSLFDGPLRQSHDAHNWHRTQVALREIKETYL